MPDYEPIIHCLENDNPHIENGISYENFTVSQSTLDGLNTLIHYLRGFENGKSGCIPGHFELVMHYRNLQGYDKKNTDDNM